MILDLIDSIQIPAIGRCCRSGVSADPAPARIWASAGSQRLDHFIVYDTAYEGTLYEGKVKTEDSCARIPIPGRVRPYIEAWRRLCPDTSPDAQMFPTAGRRKNKGKPVPFRAKNFFKWKVWPYTDELKIPHNLCTFQVFRRILGTDLQKHGTMKDAQAIMRHKDRLSGTCRPSLAVRTRAKIARATSSTGWACYNERSALARKRRIYRFVKPRI